MNLGSFSICCVVKNEEKYIKDLVDSILKVFRGKPEVEFIFVDDNSSDSTFEILQDYAKFDDRFLVIKNKKKGKVAGTNLAIENSSRDYIKFIDGDDLLSGNFSVIPEDFDCLYHDYKSFNEDNEHDIKIGNWLSSKPYQISNNFRSIPKAMFIFRNTYLKKFFPIPESLPFEDLWINLAAAEAKKIIYLNHSLYLYRQHENQFYGSLSNFSLDKKKRMADRFLKYYDYLCKNNHPFSFDAPKTSIKHYADALFFNNIISYIKLLSTPRLFVKAIFYNFPFLVRFLWNKK